MSLHGEEGGAGCVKKSGATGSVVMFFRAPTPERFWGLLPDDVRLKSGVTGSVVKAVDLATLFSVLGYKDQSAWFSVFTVCC
mgnify:CR=1 FL=1